MVGDHNSTLAECLDHHHQHHDGNISVCSHTCSHRFTPPLAPSLSKAAIGRKRERDGESEQLV